MPPKKKGKGKGKGKGKAKAEAPPRQPTEFDELPTERLEETIRTMMEDLEKAQMDRNQMQVDRDTMSNFYEITKNEVRDYDLSVRAKERELEMLEENHRVEVRVYEHKVKHLEYEHRTDMRRTEGEGTEALTRAQQQHGRREDDLRRMKEHLRSRIRAQESQQAHEVSATRSKNQRALDMTRRDFQRTLDQLRTEYEERHSQLREELQLRRKVEIHEVEERKNEHVNQLMRNHQRDFRKMKEFYNGITKKNVETINNLKNQIKKLREKQVASQALMVDISEENKRLAEPLAKATEEVMALRSELRDAEKDRFALRNAKARLKTMRKDLTEGRRHQRSLERRFEEMEHERDYLYDNFEETVHAVQRRAEYRNQVLDRKLDELKVEFESKMAQVQHAMDAAELDPSVMHMVTQRVDEQIDSHNRAARDLQYAIARVAKAHNDALRVLRGRASELGVDVSDLEFDPIPTAAGTGPAGLVASGE